MFDVGAIKNLSVDNFKRMEELTSMAHKCLLLIDLKYHFHKMFNINDRWQSFQHSFLSLNLTGNVDMY